MTSDNTREREQTAINFRRMSEADLSAASGLSKVLGWPHRIEDWSFMLRLGHGLVATLENGDIIGTILWWSFGDRHASVGLIIVNSAWQGHGIGTNMLTAVRRLLPGRSISLNATPAGQPLYEKFGFVPTGIVEQHQGNGASSPIIALDAGQRIRPVVPYDLEDIVTFDHAATGMNRSALMGELVQNAKAVVIDTENGIRGYSFCRRFGWGWLIGPVTAKTIEQAKALISHWIGTYGGEFIRIDTPAASGLSGWLDDMGLVRVDVVNTMSTEPVVVEGNAPQYFALSSQALG
ncbi:GNAT family N-acetyltransferase [Neokomagataea thailandica]|uniref:N-acetyltransferase GCN5 n=1 Tax=Neokomagataea tanensis NBRC 106556 TaxID=1223519 RepID=A0ABQ0QIT0_9PROT|nr:MULTISPECIES: GNAT family N-acetyltransferase [Neokomagataea]GBR46290.1 N-acetyltransferase GCN5 [Neokomagataea tanensis NBRC 106556]